MRLHLRCNNSCVHLILRISYIQNDKIWKCGVGDDKRGRESEDVEMGDKWDHLCINFLNSSKLTLPSPSSSAYFIMFIISSSLIFYPILVSTSLSPWKVMPFSCLESNILKDSSISFSLVMVNIILKLWREMLLCHEWCELAFVDDAVAVCIDLTYQFVDLLFGWNACHLPNQCANLLIYINLTSLVRLPSLSLSKSLNACWIYFICSLLNWLVII